MDWSGDLNSIESARLTLSPQYLKVPKLWFLRTLSLRMCEDDGCDAQAMAEIESGWAERQGADGGPEIKLIAAAATVKALEEIARDVNGEVGVTR